MGVSGVARRVKNGYIGVSGVARKYYCYCDCDDCSCDSDECNCDCDYCNCDCDFCGCDGCDECGPGY